MTDMEKIPVTTTLTVRYCERLAVLLGLEIMKGREQPGDRQVLQALAEGAHKARAASNVVPLRGGA